MSWFGLGCCASRTTKANAQRDSVFDKQLLDGFAKAAEAGYVRSHPSKISRKPLDGNFGLNAQFSEDHFAKKRKAVASSSKSVVMPVNPEAFNFTKADQREIIGVVDASKAVKPPDNSIFAGLYEVEEDPGDEVPVTVLVCASPLAMGHVLLVPRIEDKLPQALTGELMLYGLHLMTKSTRSDFRILFNSLLGFASVNHFHFHGLYLDYCSLSTKRLPIEKVDRSVIAGGRTEGRLCIELLAETQWYTRGFVLTAGCANGTEKDAPGAPQADLEALARFAGNIVESLQQRNIAHNVLIVPFLGERRARKIDETIDDLKPNAASPEVYIIPRQSEDNLREDAGFNAAILELCGALVAGSEESYNNFEEKTLIEIFNQDVSLSGTAFDELICKVAWMAN